MIGNGKGDLHTFLWHGGGVLPIRSRKRYIRSSDSTINSKKLTPLLDRWDATIARWFSVTLENSTTWSSLSYSLVGVSWVCNVPVGLLVLNKSCRNKKKTEKGAAWLWHVKSHMIHYSIFQDEILPIFNSHRSSQRFQMPKIIYSRQDHIILIPNYSFRYIGRFHRSSTPDRVAYASNLEVLRSLLL